MNIVNKLLLRLVMLATPLFRKMGVDVFLLEVIVSTKLVMDDRRPNTIQQRRKQNDKPVKWATLFTMFISALLGVFLLYGFLLGNDGISKTLLFFLMYSFILMSTLIADFTSVLIDVRDNSIILPKPVDDKTVVVARLAHIFIHVCKLVLPMILPAFIAVWVQYKAFSALVFAFIAFFCTLLVIFVINAIYILILKITTPQKFKSIISNFQIVFAVVIYGGYQLFPRLTGQLSGLLIDFSSQPLSLLLPPYWFAAGWKVLSLFSGNVIEITGAVLCFVLPVVSLYVVVKYLAPAFNQKLAMISGSGADPVVVLPADGKAVVPKATGRYSSRLAQWFTSNGAERSGFLLTWKMTARSRDFKMKVYPSVGYMLVWMVVMCLNTKGFSLTQLQQQDSKARLIILGAIYICSFLLLASINQLPYSDKYKASWIYYVAPVQAPGAIISGGVKAMLVKFCLPVVALISVLLLGLIGPAIIPNLVLGMSNQLLIASLIAYMGVKQLPFAQFQNAQQKAGGCLRTAALLSLIAAAGIGHYFVYSITPVVYIFAVMSIAATWYMMDSLKKMNWAKMEGEYAAD